MVSATGAPVADTAPWGPGNPDWADAMNDPYKVSSWIGAVDTMSGTWVSVWPPLKSSVSAMSAVDRPLLRPLLGQTVPLPAGPTPIWLPVGGLVRGRPQ